MYNVVYDVLLKDCDKLILYFDKLGVSSQSIYALCSADVKVRIKRVTDKLMSVSVFVNEDFLMVFDRVVSYKFDEF